MSHIASQRVYVTVFGVLMLGTALTVGASYLDLGRPGNISIALLIAATKATCVAAFFMHLKWERGWIYVFVAYPLILFAILMFALWPDVAYRLGDAARFLPGAH